MPKTFLFLLCVVATLHHVQGAEKPLKIYILVGQSNMQGHAHVRTFPHIGMDPRTAPVLGQMSRPDGSPRTCERVWISCIGSSAENKERHGQLTVGYGAERGGPKIGPEYTFGIYMQEMVAEPILLIKTAWGGKSLHTDFRSPSAGPHTLSEQRLLQLRKRGKDVEQAQADQAAATGHYYRQMMKHIHHVLADIQRVYPHYDPEVGYELSGFVWFQGWNDMVDGNIYPERGSPGGYGKYSELLAHFIRDVRKDLSAPHLPFVIGVMGVGGPVENYRPDQQRYKVVHSEFRKAMAAPAAMHEFKGNVTAVLTEEYWDLQLGELAARWDRVRAKRRSLSKDQTLSKDDREQALEAFISKQFTVEELATYETGASNAAYHYLGSAKIVARIGKAFAEAFVEMGPVRAGTDR